MRADPDTADLIALARETLKAEVMPHLPPDRLYPALMALNALGIAQRQLAGGAERRALAEATIGAFAAGSDLDALARDLAKVLRSGAIPESRAIHAALLAVARLEVEESNPGARVLSEGTLEEG